MRSECAESSGCIRRIRATRDLRQAKMAEAIGCSLRNYQNIEAGNSQPGYQLLSNIVHNLQVDPRELFEAPNKDRNDLRIEEIKNLLYCCSSEQLALTHKIVQQILETWPK